MPDPRDRLIIALDVSSVAEVEQILSRVGNAANFYKVGLQLFSAHGPKVVNDLVTAGKRVFLDLKFHDIPNTVAAAVREAAAMKVAMLTVHAGGGTNSMRAACQAAATAASAPPSLSFAPPSLSFAPPIIVAVTVLTSMDDVSLKETGIRDNTLDHVCRLAQLARAAGCGGVVASAQEAKALRELFPDDHPSHSRGVPFAVITPGIRLPGGTVDDQQRRATPGEAISNGATHIVVGRPITRAQDPAAAVQSILKEIELAAGATGGQGYSFS